MYAELVTPAAVRPGRLELTNTHLLFFEERPENQPPPKHVGREGKGLKEMKVPLTQIREVHLRRYMLCRSALEFFLVDQTNFFLNFKKKDRSRVYDKRTSSALMLFYSLFYYYFCFFCF